MDVSRTYQKMVGQGFDMRQVLELSFTFMIGMSVLLGSEWKSVCGFV